MEHAVIERFRSLDEAYLARAPRSERMYARFAALSSLNAKQDVESLIERVFETRNQFNEGLGAWKSPGKPMRLVYAAATVTAGRTARHFFEVRNALKERHSFLHVKNTFLEVRDSCSDRRPANRHRRQAPRRPSPPPRRRRAAAPRRPSRGCAPRAAAACGQTPGRSSPR